MSWQVVSAYRFLKESLRLPVPSGATHGGAVTQQEADRWVDG